MVKVGFGELLASIGGEVLEEAAVEEVLPICIYSSLNRVFIHQPIEIL